MSLPIFQTTIRELQMMQTKWKSEIDPSLSAPQNSSLILPNVVLASGTTVVNHLLGKKLTGWKIVRQRAAATIYDTQDTSQAPDLTLTLVSSALVTVDIEVF